MIDWNYPNFTEDEFRCSCGCGRADMKAPFMNRLQLLRSACGFAFPVTSGFRCEEYDKLIGGAGVHPLGEAGDLNLWGGKINIIVSHLSRLGINRFGLSQTGDYKKRFIHLDTLISEDHPSPWNWTY